MYRLSRTSFKIVGSVLHSRSQVAQRISFCTCRAYTSIMQNAVTDTVTRIEFDTNKPEKIVEQIIEQKSTDGLVLSGVLKQVIPVSVPLSWKLINYMLSQKIITITYFDFLKECTLKSDGASFIAAFFAKLHETNPTQGQELFTRNSRIYYNLLHDCCEDPKKLECVSVLYSNMDRFSIRLLSKMATKLVKVFQEEKVDLALDLINKIVGEHEFIPHKVLLAALIRKKQLREALFIYEKLDPHAITEFLWNRLILLCCEQHQIESAEKVYKTTNFNKTKNMIVVTSLLNGYVQAKKYDQAENLVQEITRETFPQDITFWNVVFKHYCAKSNWNRVFQIAEQLKKHGIVLNNYTHVTVFNALMDAGKESQAIKWQQEYANESPKSVQLWTSMIKNHFSAGKVDEAIRTLELMKKENCVPNSYTHAVILNGLIDCARYEHAQKWYDTYLQNSKDQYVNNAMIKLYCANGNVNQVAKQLREFTPDIVTYSILLQTFMRKKDYNNAERVVQEAEKRGFSDNIEYWNSVIKLYSEKLDIERVMEIVETLQNRNVELDTVTHVLILNALIDTGRVNQAQEWYNKYLQNTQRNVHLYTTIIKMYCASGKIEEAVKLLDRMKIDGCEPNAVTFATIIHGCISSGNSALAFDIFKAIRSKMKLSKSILDGIVYMLLLHNQTAKALRIVKELFPEHGCEPDRVTFINLLGSVKEKRDFAYLQLVIELIDKYNVNHVDLYNCIIETYFQVGMSKEAFDTFEQMKKRGVNPNWNTYRALISDHSALLYTKTLIEKLSTKKNISELEKSIVIMCMGKLGIISDREILRFSKDKSEAIWQSIFYACAQNGKGTLARKLIDTATETNEMMYRYAIVACSYQENVADAEYIFDKCLKQLGKRESITVAMIDTYSRAGLLDQAEKLGKQIIKRKHIAWTSVLAGCKKYSGNAERASRIVEQQKRYLDNVSHLLVRNIAEQEQDDELYEDMQQILERRDFKKLPGQASVVINGKLESFLSDDPDVRNKITDYIAHLDSVFKEKYGYEPKGNQGNCETLATVSALLSGERDITVSKNVRMGTDSHEFFCHLSRLARDEFGVGELRVQDKGFGHIFSNGVCSCKGKY